VVSFRGLETKCLSYTIFSSVVLMGIVGWKLWNWKVDGRMFLKGDGRERQ
jgi:hypothetical protein